MEAVLTVPAHRRVPRPPPPEPPAEDDSPPTCSEPSEVLATPPRPRANEVKISSPDSVWADYRPVQETSSGLNDCSVPGGRVATDNSSPTCSKPSEDLATPPRPCANEVQASPPDSAWANYRPVQEMSLGLNGCSAPGGRTGTGRHIPCLLQEAVDWMLPQECAELDGKFTGNYVDCTFGRGGHSREILSRLSREGRLWAFDVDPEAVAVARELEKEDPRFRILHRPFAELAEAIPADVKLDGVLMDLGVSSPQLDHAHRGFSVHEDGPLDLRMNQTQGLSAAEWLKQASTEEIAWVIAEYGEDNDKLAAERIAEAISQANHFYGINRTRELAEVVRQAKCNHDDRSQHPAKLTFQAIRIFLNEEMEQFDTALAGAFQRLKMGGQCSIITFKQKEALALRRFTREHEEPSPAAMRWNCSLERMVELFPLMGMQKDFCVKILTDPIKPSAEELARNSRARSSCVHALRKACRQTMGIYDLIRWDAVRKVEERFRTPSIRSIFAGARPEEDGFLPKDEALPSPLCEAPPEPHRAPLQYETMSKTMGLPRDCHASSPTLLEATVPIEIAPKKSVAKPSWHQVVKDYSATAQGYLSVCEGQLLRVLYAGKEGDEVGWSFGHLDGKATDRGWFPSDVARWVKD